MPSVQLTVLSSSCCTLSQVSALLDRFLFSDACSDSFARDYVSNVAQALHDSTSRRGELDHFDLPAGVDVRQTAPYFPQTKLFAHGKNCLSSGLGPTDKKQGLPPADDLGQDALDMDVGSALRSTGENARETVPPSSPSETEVTAAKEKHERETVYHDADKQKVGDKRKRKEEQKSETENAVTEHTAPDTQGLLDRKRRKKKKKQRTDLVS